MGEAILTRRSGGGSNIKSIQRGVYTLTTSSANITVASVAVAKSFVRISINGGQVEPAKMLVVGKMTTPTNLNLSVVTGTSLSVAWEITEYNNVKSMQSGTYALVDNASVEQFLTIANINPSKSILYCSYTSTSTVNTIGAGLVFNRIVNATQLGFMHNSNITHNIFWQLIEFN